MIETDPLSDGELRQIDAAAGCDDSAKEQTPSETDYRLLRELVKSCDELAA